MPHKFSCVGVVVHYLPDALWRKEGINEIVTHLAERHKNSSRCRAAGLITC